MLHVLLFTTPAFDAKYENGDTRRDVKKKWKLFYLGWSRAERRPVKPGQDIDQHVWIELYVILHKFGVLGVQGKRVGGGLARLCRTVDEIESEDLHCNIRLKWKYNPEVALLTIWQVNIYYSFFFLLANGFTAGWWWPHVTRMVLGGNPRKRSNAVRLFDFLKKAESELN